MQDLCLLLLLILSRLGSRLELHLRLTGMSHDHARLSVGISHDDRLVLELEQLSTRSKWRRKDNRW